MKSQTILLGAVFMAMLGGAALFLGRIQSGQKLSEPGLKIVSEVLYDEDKKVAATNAVFLPPTFGSFTSTPNEVQRMELNWLPPDTTYGRRRYSSTNGFWADVSIVLMGRDRTSIHKPQYCLTGQGFVINRTERDKVRIPSPEPYELPVMKLTTSKEFNIDGRRVPTVGLYVYWFISDDQMTEDHLQRMWWMARDMVFTGTLKRWAYVTVFSLCLPGQEAETYERMKSFMAESVPLFQTTRLRAEKAGVVQGSSNISMNSVESGDPRKP